jgi:hypothetical protein
MSTLLTPSVLRFKELLKENPALSLKYQQVSVLKLFLSNHELTVNRQREND